MHFVLRTKTGPGFYEVQRVFHESLFHTLVSRVSDQDIRPDHEENSRMGYGVEVFRQSQVWIVPVRVVVYGIRYRIDIHVFVLALTSKSSVTSTVCVTCFPFWCTYRH